MEREDIRRQMMGVVATVPTPFDEYYNVDYGTHGRGDGALDRERLG